MGKVKVGNSANAKLNGERAKHVRKDGKRETAATRRLVDKKVTRSELKEANDMPL